MTTPTEYSEVDLNIVMTCAKLGVPDLLPIIDGLLAATAIAHNLTLVTRSTADVESTNARFIDPFN